MHASTHMPAEWERHEATWISWPANVTDWPGKFAPIPWVFGEMARKITPGEILRIIVNDAAHEGKARRVLERAGVDLAAVEFFRFPTNRGWTRDMGPMFVRDTAGRVRAFPLGDADAIDSLLARWRADLTPGSARRSPVAWRTSGATLRRRVWDPFAPALAGAREVWLVPDGPLAELPWIALPTTAGRTLLDAPFLIRRVSSERDLIAADEAAAGRGLLAVGGAAFAEPGADTSATKAEAACAALRGPFAPLPGTLAEIAEVAARWRAVTAAESVTTLAGASASEAAFRSGAPGRRVLHVATHAFRLADGCDTRASVADARGIGGLAATTGAPAKTAPAPTPALGARALLGSGLLLAGADHAAARPADDDGVLSAEDIAALDLRGVELAVLSACDTGIGEQLAGEGTLGLERAFRIAGVRATISSLWAVDDAATRDWMRRFYDAGGAAAARANDAASLAARTVRATPGREHPFWWAPFVTAGGSAH